MFEALLVAVAGAALALAANQLSPRGLQLTRNYFPPADKAANASGSPARAARGFPTVDRAAVAAWVEDPLYAQGVVLLLDARNDSHYRAGRIPGALQFDHYRAEQHLAAVIPASLAAERIVVYCGSAGCEDSEFAARMLRDAGIPGDRLFIYEGGMADWRAAGLPVETGARFSGEIKTGAP